MIQDKNLKFNFDLSSQTEPQTLEEGLNQIKEEYQNITPANYFKEIFFSKRDISILLRLMLYSIFIFTLICSISCISQHNYHDLFSFLHLTAIFFIVPLLVISFICLINILIDKRNLSKIFKDESNCINRDLRQLNQKLVNKNDKYEVRFLYEIIKEGTHIKTNTYKWNDRYILKITVDDQYEKFDQSKYSQRELESIFKLNDQYKIETRDKAFKIYNQYVKCLADSQVLKQISKHETLEDIENEYQRIKQAAKR